MNADSASPPAGIFDIALPPSPYPGLRAFEKNEWVIYFGREKATEKVVTQLLQTQFVALHGDSGCGKSSLVRAGVLPRLERECARGGATWRTTIMLPRAAPLWNLATALAELDGEVTEARVHEFRRVLNLGADGAERLAQMVRKDENDFVCVLVDQFEEIFQFADNVDRSEAQHFIDILTGVQRAKPPGLHFILTMRSEFLGACASFDGLADTINETQYLLPRMERSDMVRALCEPARLYNGTMELALAQRIIADAGTTQDQLPLMQHAAMRLHRRVSSHLRPDQAWTISSSEYQKAGGPAQILSDHADEVYLAISGETEAQPSTERGRLVRRIFQAITEDADGHMVRRPRTIGQLSELTGLSIDEMLDLLAPLRADGVSFIRIFASGPERERQIVDISHEALMRNWRRLGEWIQDETKNGGEYRRLLENTGVHLANRSELLITSSARQARKWWDEQAPTQVWADRYSKRTPGVMIGDVLAFIDASLDPKKREFELWREELAMAIETHADGRRGLLTGPEVDVARRHIKDRSDELAPEERSFVESSIAADDAEKAAVQKRRRRIIIGSISAAAVSLSLAVVAGIFSVIASDESRKAGEQRNEAIQFKSKLQGAMARDWLRDDDKGASVAGLLASDALSDGTACGLDLPRPHCSEALASLRAAVAAQKKPLKFFEGAVRRGFNGPIQNAALNQAAKRVALSRWDNRIEVRNLDSGEQLALLSIAGCQNNGHTKAYPNCIAGALAPFSDGKRVLANYFDGTLRIWDIASGKELTSWKPDLSSLDFSGDQSIMLNAAEDAALITATDQSFVMPLKQGSKPVELRGAYSACFADDGKSVIALAGFDEVQRFNAKTGKPVGKAQEISASKLICLPNGKVVAAGYSRIFELDSNTLATVKTADRGISDSVSLIAASPDSAWLAIGSFGSSNVEIIDLTNFKSGGVFASDGEDNRALLFADADKLLVAGISLNSFAEWSMSKLTTEATSNREEISLSSLAAIESNSEWGLISIADNGRLGVFHSYTDALGSSLATFSLAGPEKQAEQQQQKPQHLSKIRVRDVVCPPTKKTIPVEKPAAGSNAAEPPIDCSKVGYHFPAFAAKTMFILGDKRLFELNVADMTTIRSAPAPEGAGSILDAGGNMVLLRGNLDNLAYPVLLDAGKSSSDTIIHPFPITAGAVNKAGNLAVTGDSNGDVRLWSAETKLVRSWRAHEDDVRLVAISPDTSDPDTAFIVTSDSNGEVRARTLEGDLIGEDYAGENLSYLFVPPGGNTIIAIGESGQAYRWELRPAETPDGARTMALAERAFGERIEVNVATGQVYSRVEARLVPVSWSAVEVIPPEIERAFAEVIASRPMSRQERISAGLPPSLSAVKWEGGSDACETLADNPFDGGRRTAGVRLDAIDIDAATQACTAAREKNPTDGRFDLLYARVLIAQVDKAEEEGDGAKANDFRIKGVQAYSEAMKKGYRFAPVVYAINDDKMHIDLLEKAWNDGETSAAINLAIAYEKGQTGSKIDPAFSPDMKLAREWNNRGARAMVTNSLGDVGTCWRDYAIDVAPKWSAAGTLCEPFGKTTLSREARQALALYHYDIFAMRYQFEDGPSSFLPSLFRDRREIALGMPMLLAGCVHIEAAAKAASAPVRAMDRDFMPEQPPAPLASTRKACKAEFEKHGVVLALGGPPEDKKP